MPDLNTRVLHGHVIRLLYFRKYQHITEQLVEVKLGKKHNDYTTDFVCKYVLIEF